MARNGNVIFVPAQRCLLHDSPAHLDRHTMTRTPLRSSRPAVDRFVVQGSDAAKPRHRAAPAALRLIITPLAENFPLNLTKTRYRAFHARKH